MIDANTGIIRDILVVSAALEGLRRIVVYFRQAEQWHAERAVAEDAKRREIEWIKQQLQPNGGSSLRDQVDGTRREVAETRRELQANTAATIDVRNRVDQHDRLLAQFVNRDHHHERHEAQTVDCAP